jgi:hypothetical protein
VVGEKVDPGIRESLTRPGYAGRFDGPYLTERQTDLGGRRPLADEATPDRDSRTHDVYEKMIAQAYRRGLRVRPFNWNVRPLLRLLSYKRQSVVGIEFVFLPALPANPNSPVPRGALLCA